MGGERCCEEAVLLPCKIAAASSYPELFSLETIVVSAGINKAATEGALELDIGASAKGGTSFSSICKMI